MVEQHRGSRHQHAPLGGDAVAAAGVARFSGARLVGGQVQSLGQLAVVIGAELAYCLVQRVGKLLGGNVRAAEGIGGLLHRLRQHGRAAGCPVAGRRAGPGAQRPGQRGVAQVFLGDAVRIADGENGDGQPLSQAGVGVFDGLGLAAEPGLGFQDNPQAVHVGHDVHAPAAGPPFKVGFQTLLTQQQRQSAVLKIFLLTGHGVMLPAVRLASDDSTG